MARRYGSGAAVQPLVPAAGFTSQKAEKWILTSALMTALIYGFRRLVEGDTSPKPSTNAAREFLGQGAPPDFAQWLIAWGTGYGLLALFALALPELAAAFAMLTLLVTLLESGSQLATDLQTIEHTAGSGAAASSSGSGGGGAKTGITSTPQTAPGAATHADTGTHLILPNNVDPAQIHYA